MTAPSPTGVSMRDLLASCAAADAISRPPGPEERPEAARGPAVPPAAAACARADTTGPQPNDGPATAPPTPRAAA
ncbi:hypothetical protein [Streptomyces broussonetiae]|uniref:Uncharacterized protein n=1 Tax=Streptomyces broussonetiae TaxID=2686304 RepID=A0A6I6NBJ8_9ACTN|nr:hypothetical protein [Streptomyces broussonetiae]QHA06325.1 hypothetical protein GQF42_26300 [Streptomyces broussonetiae]